MGGAVSDRQGCPGGADPQALSEMLEATLKVRDDFAAAVGALEARVQSTRGELASFRAALASTSRQLEGAEHDLRAMRSALETEEALRRSLLVRGCIAAIDDLARALGVLPTEGAAWGMGAKMVRDGLVAMLAASGVEQIPALPGEAFDPSIHEAVATEGQMRDEPPVVLEEVLPGYRAGGKVLRPAKVRAGWRESTASPQEVVAAPKEEEE